MSYLPHLIALLVGAGLAVQVGMNSTVRLAIGSPVIATIVNFGVGLIGLLLLGLVVAAVSWFASAPPAVKPAGARATKPGGEGKPAGPRKIGAPRSANALVPSDQPDVSADARPPDARRESIVRTGLGELQEMQQMNQAVFDAAWKTQDDEAKAAVVPRMEAMWKEAIGLLREEFEKSVREADAGVK